MNVQSGPRSRECWEGQRKDLNKTLTLKAASGLGGCGGNARPTLPLPTVGKSLTFFQSGKHQQQLRMRKAQATVTVLVVEG